MEPQGPDRGGAGASPDEQATPESRLSAVLSETPDIVLLLEPTDGSFLCRMAIGSYPSAPGLPGLHGLRMDEILPRDMLQRFEDHRHESLRRGEPARYEERLGTGDDALVLDVTVTIVLDEHGPTGRLFWSARDVTGEWAARQALRRAEARAPKEEERADLAAEREVLEAERAALEERLRTLEQEARRLEELWSAVREHRGAEGFLFREALVGLAWTDPEGTLLEANRPLATLLGREPEDLPGLTLPDAIPEPERSDLDRVLTELRVGALTSAGLDARLLPVEGEPVPVRIALTAEPGDGLRRILWQVEDHTERRELQDLLAHQALHDPLTGMPNRALFLDRLGRALARLDRRPGTIAVMVIDIDRFGAVNDEHGHEVGDRVLGQLAERIEHASRASDTVARLESDEFALICEDLAESEGALGLSERLRASVEQAAVVVNGVTVEVGLSIGIALGHEAGDRPESLLRDATTALREAKAAGRGRTEVFDEARRARAAQEVRTNGDLALALEREELRLFYQPLIDLSRGVIVAVEALIRWQHPERGLLTPAEFITRAEDSGLIVDIGAWVLEEACRQSRLWIGTEPITTWINVSPRQLADGLPDLVSKALAHSGAEPESIAVEVTEGVLLDGATGAIEVLREVHDMGIKVGIDDFGKGFSSLTYLRELPVDVVKLDMAFVHGLGVREEDDAIAEAVVNLAKAIELTSVGEGVETPEQLARLRELGCDLAQGYLFASPQPPEVVQQLLSQNLRW